MGNDYFDFLNDLGNRESGGNYKAENSIGYIGKYQFGESMMDDLGYYDSKDGTIKNDWKGNWIGKNGIYNKNDFLNNPEEQEKAIRKEMEILNKRIEKLGLDNFINTEHNGIYVTRSGLLAGAHLKGVGGGC